MNKRNNATSSNQSWRKQAEKAFKRVSLEIPEISPSQVEWYKSREATPVLYTKIQKEIQKHIDNQERLLIYREDNTSPQNAIVLTLEKAYERFASGYTYNKIDDSKTPYTLNYSALLDRSNKTFIKVEKK